MQRMREILFFIVVGVFLVLLVGGSYWIAKHGSYYLWYEEMVKGTVQEMVKPECLIGD